MLPHSRLIFYSTIIICINKVSYLKSLGHEINILKPPIVLNTWNFTQANGRAIEVLRSRHSALDAIVAGCSECERLRCDGTVGWGGSPSELGETTLDAMIMNGDNFDVGAVGGLRQIKDAISVARVVLDRTEHSLLVGESATRFAIEMGFKEESLSSNESITMYHDWLSSSCQPNYWKNVSPNPKKYCGPYKPTNKGDVKEYSDRRKYLKGHDTIGMVAMDSNYSIAAGTSTNGLRYKISGRVGDSPIPGAGAYADSQAGAAAATGDGDVIMRHLLSYQAVENLRQGLNAQQSANDVISRMISRIEYDRLLPQAAVVVLGINGDFGSACCGIENFHYVLSDRYLTQVTRKVECLNRPETNQFGSIER